VPRVLGYGCLWGWGLTPGPVCGITYPAMTNGDQGPVLIVEDDTTMRDALEAMLDAAGYAVVGVRSANEALDQLAAGPPPCLILLDITLPDMQGDRLYATIRADPVLATIPVLVLTGLAEPPELPGVVATMLKGVPADALLGVIDATCRPDVSRTPD
jgi:two-component system response regulator CpxR